MNQRWLGYGSLILAVVLLFAVNIFSTNLLSGSRMDLTQNNVYTLSKGTVNILETLEEPITVRLYLSQTMATRLPAIGSYAARVKELLSEYERVSQGKLNVHQIDPEPFSEEEDRAVGYGLSGVPLNEGDETFYFGVVGTNSTDDEEIIPFLSTSREQFLEYDITKLIHNLANPKQPKVGLIEGLSMQGTGPGTAIQGPAAPPWTIVTHLHQLFDVIRIAQNQPQLPEELDALIVAHPKALPEQMLYLIDQYVMGGGRLLVFTDPQADNERIITMGMAGMAPGQRSSDFNRLLIPWGVEMDPKSVAGDLSLAATVSMDRQGRMVTFRYPAWMNVQPANFNNSDPVTAQLGNVSFGTPGRLKAVEGATTTFTPLISTSAEAAQFGLEAVSAGADPQDMMRTYKPGNTKLVLAARISGEVKSAFPDGAPAKPVSEDSENAPPKTATDPKPEHLAQSKSPISVIVVADTDMLHDRFWVQVQDFMGQQLAIPSAANGDFVINAVDNLTGSGDLISVRNRGTFIRPFERINAMQREAEVEYREKEEELVKRLSDAEQNLAALQEGRSPAAKGNRELVLSDAQKQEILKFRQERLRIRKDLRQVRLDLRRKIESLQGWLKFANIGLVPLLIGVFGLLVGIVRLSRRRAPHPAAAL